MTTANIQQNNEQENSRKNPRKPKVRVIDGTKDATGKGAWKIVQCDKNKIPIYATKCKEGVLYQVPCKTQQGKATKRSFTDADEAIAFASQLAQLPPHAAATFVAIPNATMLVLVDMLDVLKPVLAPLGISLSAGVEEYAGAKQLVGHRDLREIVKNFLSAAWEKKSHTPLKDAIQEFLLARKGAGHRQTYLDTLQRNLRRLALEFGNHAIGDITKEQLLKVIKTAGKPRSQKTFQTSFRTFFKWSKVQEYLNPAKFSAAEKLEKIIVVNPPPGIYRVEEVRKMLGKAPDVPSVLYLVLALFTGIRQIELGRIDWSAVNKDGTISVEATHAKGYRRRTVPIQPLLEAWLKPFYGQTGLIIPIARMRGKIADVLSRLGISFKRNGPRHSYASYRLAQTGSPTKTAEEDGHSAYVLERDYLHRVSLEAAQEYFSLTPAACGRAGWEQEVREYLFGRSAIIERKKRNPKAPWPNLQPRTPAEVPQKNDTSNPTPELPGLAA